MQMKILADAGSYREQLVKALACLGHSCKVVLETGDYNWQTHYYVVVDSENINVTENNTKSTR